MEFNESTGQNEVIRHRAQPDKHIDQQSDKKYLASSISLSFYFPIPIPPQITQIPPFPCLWFLLQLSDSGLVQSPNAPPCIPYWIPYLHSQPVGWPGEPLPLPAGDGAHSLPGCPARGRVGGPIPLPAALGFFMSMETSLHSQNVTRWKSTWSWFCLVVLQSDHDDAIAQVCPGWVKGTFVSLVGSYFGQLLLLGNLYSDRNQE